MLVNGERALAYVVTIDEIKPLPGYDRVEYARTSGWWCVISKNDELAVGDKCIYFEVDSKVPEDDYRFSFLAPKKYKIKTQKMCKVYSQGLLMPLSKFPELGDLPVGADVTKRLGVMYHVAEDNVRKANSVDKYKAMAQRNGKLFSKQPFRWLMKRDWGKKLLFVFFGRKKDKPRGFPSFIKKTDEERCENQPWRVGDGRTYIVTEKCLSARMIIRTDDGFHTISEIVNKKLPVKVATYNFDTEQIEYQPILEYHRIEQKDSIDTYRIGVGCRGKGNRPKFIECTGNHMLMVNGQWKRADEIAVGDTLSHYADEMPHEAFEMILGSLIGDASIYNKKSYVHIGFSHSIKQKDYLNYKRKILGKYCAECQHKISGYGSEVIAFVSRSNLFIDKYVFENCIVNGKKTITKQWCNDMTPISLAFWYMDDGTVQNRDNPNLGERATLCTNALSDEECKLLQEMLLNRFGIETKLHSKESYKGNVLSLGVDATKKFFSLIAPYVCSSMKYKLSSKYDDMPCVFESFTPTYSSGVVDTKVLSVEKYEPKAFGGYMFDLTTANHNYFAQSVLVHNCDGTSCTYALKRKRFGYEFYVCSRNVRQRDENQNCYHDHNIYWDMAFKYNIEQHLKDYLNEHKDLDWVYIQGEGVGYVQGNPLKLADDDLYIFNFVTSREGRFNSYVAKDIVESWGMKHVPLLGMGKTQNTMEEMKEYADGMSVINPAVMREGLVYRSLDGIESFKNVSRKYLLKHNG